MIKSSPCVSYQHLLSVKINCHKCLKAQLQKQRGVKRKVQGEKARLSQHGEKLQTSTAKESQFAKCSDRERLAAGVNKREPFNFSFPPQSRILGNTQNIPSFYTKSLAFRTGALIPTRNTVVFEECDAKSQMQHMVSFLRKERVETIADEHNFCATSYVRTVLIFVETQVHSPTAPNNALVHMLALILSTR